MQTDRKRPRHGRRWLIAGLSALLIVAGHQTTSAQQSPQEIWEKARNGDADAQLALGYHYQAENHADYDLKTARYWFERAAEAGSGEAAARLGILLLDNPQQPEDIELAIASLSSGAEAGIADAQFRLASALATGLALAAPDPRLARVLYERAAAQSHPGAQASLGVYYFQGIEGEQSIERAAQLFRASALQGHPLGQYHMAVLHMSGQGANSDPSQALQWLQQAVAQDLPQAVFALGRLHVDGQLVQQNTERGVELVKRAARAGFAEAQFQMGVWEGRGTYATANEQAAVGWYSDAAKQGHPDAQFLLGNHLATGRGIAQDLDQGIFWLEAAARSGHPVARQRIDKFLQLQNAAPQE